MQPTNERLLSGIAQALDTLEKAGLPPETATTLSHLRLAIGELTLREDRGFVRAQLTHGATLLEQGAALARRQGLDAGATVAIPAEEAPLPQQLACTYGEVADRLAQLTTLLVPFEDTDGDVKSWLAAVVDWENALYARRLSPPSAQDEARSDAELFSNEAISAYLSARFPVRAPVGVENMRRLSGGFSKTTVLFDAVYADGVREELVIRADPLQGLLFLEASHVENEFPALKVVFKAGLPVAEPLWLEADESRMGRRFLVSRKGRGHNIGSRVDVDDRFTESLLGDFLQRLVQIHNTPVSPDDPDVAASHLARLARMGTIKEVVEAQVAQWRRGIAGFALPPSPLRNRTLEWLARNIPDCDEKPALLHGDYGLHNILIEDEKISCILDWESVTMGDPADELAWLTDGLRAQIEPQKVIGLYEEISGRRITPDRLRYFAVYNALRFMATCPRGLDLFQADPRAGIAALDLGLRFTFFGSGELNPRIAAAETI
nr:phosphotransferase family protein [Sphingomonas sp. CDS-1]